MNLYTLISENNDVSLNEDRVFDFICFIFEKENSHKYGDPHKKKKN